jgi:hypothetical protein
MTGRVAFGVSVAPFIRYYYDQIKTREMGGECRANGVDKHIYKGLVGKLEEKNHLKYLGVDVQKKLILKLTWISLRFIAYRCYDWR